MKILFKRFARHTGDLIYQSIAVLKAAKAKPPPNAALTPADLDKIEPEMKPADAELYISFFALY